MVHNSIKKVYKYKTCDKYLFELLENKEMYAPKIEKLNDPFESSVYIKDIDGRKLKKRYFAENYNELFDYKLKANSKTEDFLNKYFNNFVKNPISEKNFEYMEIQTYRSFYQKLVSMVGIISFSSDNKSLLLWSHYAEGHKGVCIEFEREGNSSLADEYYSFPVRYSSFIEEVKIQENSKDTIAEFFKYKSDAWSYEKEWRVITEAGNTSVKIPGEITGIYFGISTSEENMKKVYNILGGTVKYYKAKKVENKYEVEYVPYNFVL